MIHCYTSDKDAFDFVLAWAVKKPGSTPKANSEVVSRVLMADGNHIGSNARAVIAHVVVGRISYYYHAPVTQAETRMPIPDDIHCFNSSITVYGPDYTANWAETKIPASASTLTKLAF
jgi:hypothetical protein